MSSLPYIDPYLTAIQYTNYFDRKGARDFSAVNKEARRIYLADDVQKVLISKYFRCPLSTTRPLKDQYLGLTIARAGRSIPALTERIPTQGDLLCLKINSYGMKALFHSTENYTFNLLDLVSKEYIQTIYASSEYTESFEQTSMNAKSTRILSIFDEYPHHPQGKILQYCDTKKGNKFIALTGYKDFKEIQMNDEGTRALSLSRDFELILWDLDESKSVNVFSGISCFKMCPDGKTALLGSMDGTLKRLNMMDNECFAMAHSHRNKITGLQISRDGTKVLSGSSEGNIHYWTLSLDGAVSTIRGKDPTFLFMNADATRALLQGRQDGRLYLWDLETNKSIRGFRRPSPNKAVEHVDHYINRHSMSSDGSRALVLSAKLELWDLTTGKCIYIFPQKRGNSHEMQKSDDELQVVVYNKDDSAIEVWDLAPAYQIPSVGGCTLF